MNIAVLLAGGHGLRMKSQDNIPKQFIDIDGKPIIVHTLERLTAHPMIHGVQIVCVPEWMDKLGEWLTRFDLPKICGITPGCASRYLSTRAGMEALTKVQDGDVLIVHDSVRPLFSADALAGVIEVCAAHGNAMMVLPCNDTMYEKTTAEFTAATVNREQIVRGQTPEAVTGARMKAMYRAADAQGITSDSISALQAALGWPIYFAPGDELNIKITHAEDLTIFRALYKIV